MPNLSINVTNRQIDLISVLFLGALISLIYYQTASFGYILLDDPSYIFENVTVLKGLSLKNIRWAVFSAPESYWGPLTWISFMMEVQWLDAAPSAMHTINVILHGFNSGLVYGLVVLLSKKRWPSLMVASLFAAHPLHVEAVAWITERKEVLSTFFALLCILSYIRFVKSASTGRYLLSLALFMAAICSKPSMASLPMLLFCINKYVSADTVRKNSTAIVSWMPFAIIAVLVSIITICAQADIPSLSLKWSYFNESISRSVVSYAFYLYKTIYPVNLSVFYPYRGMPVGMDILQAATVIIVVTAIIYKVKEQKLLLLGWLWYLVTLLPASGIVRFGHHAYADRFSYFPLIGIFIIVVFTIPQLKSRLKQRFMNGALLVGVLCCAFLSWQQCKLWQDSEGLFRHALALDADNYLAMNHLGVVLEKQGRFEEAIPLFTATVAEKPDFLLAHNSLGTVYMQLDMPEQAIQSLSTALQIAPDFDQANNNMASAYFLSGDLDTALHYYRKTLTINPDNNIANTNIAVIYFQKSNYKKTLEHLLLAEASIVKSTYLAYSYYEQEDYKQCIDTVRLVLQKNTNNKGMHKLMAAAVEKIRGK